MVPQIAQYTKFCYEFGIISGIIFMSSDSIVFVRQRTARVVKFGNFCHKSADQSSLEDLDKQQISFFVIRFTMEYSDRLVATAAPKTLDFQFPKVLGSVRLSLWLCKILVQFVTFIFFSGHLRICFT